MKRAISLFLSLIMLFSAAFAVNLTASADEAILTPESINRKFSGEYDGRTGSMFYDYTVVRRNIEIEIEKISDDGEISGKAYVTPSKKNDIPENDITCSYYFNGNIDFENSRISLQGEEMIDEPVRNDGSAVDNFSFVALEGTIDINSGKIDGTSEEGIWVMNSVVNFASVVSNMKFIHNDFKTGSKEFKGKYGYYYSDGYFLSPSTSFNHPLATMSLCLAFSTYQSENGSVTYQNAEKILKECKFNKDEIETFDYEKETTANGVGCIIANKKIGGKTLIAVAVRSGGYGHEWASNALLAENGNHKGFDDSADKVIGYLDDYITENGIDGEIKIWLTGFSRGAAVATHTAAKLNNGELNAAQVDKSNIYAYGFATPAGASASNNPTGKDYNNIFSVIDFNDPVPLVAPAQWKLERFGKTRIFPYKYGLFGANKYLKNMMNYMKGIDPSYVYNLDDFEYSGIDIIGQGADVFSNKQDLGLYNRKLVKKIAKEIGSRERYVSDFQSSLSNYFETDIELLLTEVLVKEFLPIIAKHPIITATALKNKDIIVKAHSNQEYYLSWMQSMDPNYAKAGSIDAGWGAMNYREVKVNCPVNVTVYDSDNKAVASIIDEQPGVESEDILATIDENGQKVFYLPIDGKYHIDVKARENCTVNVGVDEFNAELGDYSRAVGFNEITMNQGESLNAEIPAFSIEETENGCEEGSEVPYSVQQNGNSIDSSFDYRGADEVSQHTFELNVKYNEKYGDVLGSDSYVEGSFALLCASPKEGCAFDGFYRNGEKLTDEDYDNNPNTLRLAVYENTEIEARFSGEPVATAQAEETETGEKSGGLSGGVIALIVILSLVALGGIIIAVAFATKKKDGGNNAPQGVNRSVNNYPNNNMQMPSYPQQQTPVPVTAPIHISSEAQTTSARTITVVFDDGSREDFTVSEKSFLKIGKDPAWANAVIPTKYTKASRKHCTISYNAKRDRFIVDDLSTNGVEFASGKRLPKGQSAIIPGTTLTISCANFRIKL